VIDDALGDEVRVTVIAAGFDGGSPPRRQPGVTRQPDLRARPQATTRPEPTPAPPIAAPVAPPVPRPAPRPAPPVDDELDIPDFLK